MLSLPEIQSSLVEKYIAGDELAFKELVSSCGGLVRRIVAPFASNFDLDDLRSEASIGIMKAARKFNGKHGGKFSGFVYPYIQAQVYEYVRNNIGAASSPKSRRERKIQSGLPKRIRKLEGTMPDKKMFALLAEEFKTTPDHIEAFVGLRNGTGGITEDMFDHCDENAFEDCHANQRARVLSEVLCVLDDRERLIIQSRFTESVETFDNIAEKLNISRERVRKVEIEALRKLSVELESRGLAFADLA